MTVIRGLKDAPTGDSALRGSSAGKDRPRLGDGTPVPAADVRPQGDSGEWLQQFAWAIEDGSLEWATYFLRWIMSAGEAWAQAQAHEIGLERLKQAPEGKGSAAALVRLYHHFGPLFPRGHTFHEVFLERLEQRVRAMSPGPAALTVTGAIDRALEFFQRGLETYPAYAGLAEAMRDLKAASHRAVQKEREQELEGVIATGDYNRALELCRTLIETYRSPLASGLMPSILAQLGHRGTLDGGEGTLRRQREWGWPDGQDPAARSGHLRMVKSEDGEAPEPRIPKTPWGRAFDAPSDRAISEARLKRSAEKSGQVLQMPRRDDPVSIPDSALPETDTARAGTVAGSAAGAGASAAPGARSLDSAAQPIGLENLRKPGRTDEESRTPASADRAAGRPSAKQGPDTAPVPPSAAVGGEAGRGAAEDTGKATATGSAPASTSAAPPLGTDAQARVKPSENPASGTGSESSSPAGEGGSDSGAFRPQVEVRTVKGTAGTSTGRLGRESGPETPSGGSRRTLLWLLLFLFLATAAAWIAWLLGLIPVETPEGVSTPVAVSTAAPVPEATPAAPRPPEFKPPDGPPGTLTLDIVPDDKLELYLDGEFQPDGKVSSRTLPSGTHLLEIYREGYEQLRQEIVTSAGSDTRMQVTLQKSPSISLEVQPAGDDLTIILDGRKVTARAPLKGYVIPPGRHVLELRREGFQPYKEEFQAMSAAALQFKINLTPLPVSGP